MYWIYLALFILAVLVPDLVREPHLFLPEENLEELAIFLLGMAGFFIFVFKDKELSLQKIKEKRGQKKLQQTAKDLVESYSYIGEVNRKMDMLMQIGLGLSDKETLNKSKEKEIYHAIVNAADGLMKTEKSSLRFVGLEKGDTLKEIFREKNSGAAKNAELLEMTNGVNIKKLGKFFVAASLKKIKGVRCFLLIENASELEEQNPNNHEILKYLATQALFLYSYADRRSKNDKISEILK
jgi:hypothetical protein